MALKGPESQHRQHPHNTRRPCHAVDDLRRPGRRHRRRLVALSYLKRFRLCRPCSTYYPPRSCSAQEGNVQFHTARSTAFPQPAPGAAPSPGPDKYPRRCCLRCQESAPSRTCITTARSPSPMRRSQPPQRRSAQSSGASARAVSIGNFAFNPASLEVPAGDG